jgi:aspartate aminotransferase
MVSESTTIAATRLAERMSRLGTESAFEVLARARALEARGRSIVHLEIGEPDFDTPAHVVEAAAEALRGGFTHYVPAPGLPEAREAVADWLFRTGRLQASPDRVVLTPGAKPIMWYLMLATCQEGDEVIYPDPGFPMYESIARFAGATPVPLPLRGENQFRPDPEELARLVTPRTRLLVLNSPNNPCGSALSRQDCEAVADIAMRNDLLVLADEVYWAIRYGGEHHSVLDADGMADRTVLLDGWSKTYAMTGWRLRFGVFPPALVEPVSRLVINSVSCTSAFSQKAAIAALTGPQDPVEQMVAEFRRRRDVIVDGLNAIEGITCVRPSGAFYVFPSVKAFERPSKLIEEHLLDRAGVAALSGTAFGQYGEGYLRFSYANSVQAIRQALDAMAALLPYLAA